MAKSKSFFGLRKGSTKSHTYSVLDGQQVTKDRVYDVKNPRTEGQMKQRMLMTTVGAAYKYLKAIADHSFEGKSSGMQCMREFNSRNLNRFKYAAAANGTVPFNEYKDGDINPLPFILSDGSLPGFDYQLNSESHLELSFEAGDQGLSTAEGIYEAMGIKRGDLVTFCSVIGESSTRAGVYEYVAQRFDIVRLSADKSGNVANPIDAFTVSYNNYEAKIDVKTDSNKLTITGGECDFGAVIQSRNNGTSWLRSQAIMIVNEDVVSGAKTANQRATYPVGTELILNNGPMAREETPALQAPSLSFAQNSLSIEGDEAKQLPTLNGVPDGASVSYSSKNSSIATVNQSGQVTPVKNGTVVIEARSSATDEYAAGSATCTVTISGIAEPVEGDDDSGHSGL